MKPIEILKSCTGLDVYEMRCKTDEFVELVFMNAQTKLFEAALAKNLGDELS